MIQEIKDFYNRIGGYKTLLKIGVIILIPLVIYSQHVRSKKASALQLKVLEQQQLIDSYKKSVERYEQQEAVLNEEIEIVRNQLATTERDLTVIRGKRKKIREAPDKPLQELKQSFETLGYKPVLR